MKLIRSLRKRIQRVKTLFAREPSPPGLPSPAITASAPSQPAENLLTRQEMDRWLTQSRWFVVDQCEKSAPAMEALRCPICECTAPPAAFPVHESYCQFGGGRLLRHECPQCGVIFGPQKMFRLTPDELSQEYRQLYEFYRECDTTENEIRTFHSMQPKKSGVYLNFGSGGGWNSSVTQLRAQGWNIFGFEPYATTSAEATIRSFAELETMHFDGIMSNNVLEHLTDPIATFRLWRRLLKGSAVMAHSTPCFQYRFAITRFHLFFFTGGSLDEICRRAGFRGEWAQQDGDYLCYRFAPGLLAQAAA